MPYLNNEKERISYLTNAISIVLFSLTLIVGLAYYIANTTESLERKIWLAAPLFIAPYIFNKFGKINISRLWLTAVLPIAVMFISVFSKAAVINLNIINPVNYFDIRIILMNALIIPFVLYSFNELKQLLFALSPTIICLLLFDPIHDFFSVGYYDAGMMSPDYYFSANLFTIITMIFLSLTMVFLKNQILKSEHTQTKENNEIKLYLSELVKLSNSSNVNDGKIELAKQEIILSAYACLGVSRVSIWAFNHNNESIKCEYLLDKNEITTPGSELFAAQYPSYFVELKHQQLIIATDAENHPATSEFTENYLKPLSIYSLMDAPFLSMGKLGGVICCEHQYEYKQWGPAESLLLKALGDFLSYTIIVDERLKQNQLLTQKNEEITTINDNLEKIVASRTKELEVKNAQLTEYAYINSHVLRAPVARISGLYNLFKTQTEKIIEEPAILDYMENSIQELEEITLQINRAIEESSNFDRKNIKQQ